MGSRGTRITVLVDNRANPGLAAEHGLSLWVETRGGRILFDTGQGGALLPNARSLGARINSADAVVLSHGHFDHSGGLDGVLAAARGAEVCCHPGALRARYSRSGGSWRPVHMPDESRTAIESLPASRIRWASGPCAIAGGTCVTGPVPRETGFEDAGGPFFLDAAGTETDSIEDDLAMWIETGRGAVVCVGCCHAGVVNTLNRVMTLSGLRIRAVVGGFHLLNAGDLRLNLTADALLGMDLETAATCHCTGGKAESELRKTLGGRLWPAAAGDVFEFG